MEISNLSDTYLEFEAYHGPTEHTRRMAKELLSLRRRVKKLAKDLESIQILSEAAKSKLLTPASIGDIKTFKVVFDSICVRTSTSIALANSSVLPVL